MSRTLTSKEIAAGLREKAAEFMAVADVLDPPRLVEPPTPKAKPKPTRKPRTPRPPAEDGAKQQRLATDSEEVTMRVTTGNGPSRREVEKSDVAWTTSEGMK